MILPKSKLVTNQKQTIRTKINESETLIISIRYDDECGNGYNTFAITAEHRVNGILRSCGCLHDMIKEHYPALIPLLKWHLCSSDGPIHYIENTLFHAGNKDCWGYTKGQPKLRKDGSYILSLNSDTGRYSLVYGNGKERELDHARNSAIWPDTTDEELTSPDLKERLEARLPKLLEEFHAAITNLGFEW